MKFFQTEDGINGTHLQGEVSVSYARLVEVFGEPNCDGDGYKVQKEWAIKFKDGTIATIYDWKEGDNYNGPGQGTHYTKVENWHVGGHQRTALFRVQEALDGEHELSTDAQPRYTVDQIADAAEKACFYVTPGGLWLRMDFCDMDSGYFQAHDEDSGEEYRIEFSELVYDDVEFHKLEKMKI